MTHDRARLLTAGAALGDLDATERRDADGHLAACPPCQRLVIELDGVLADLALAAPARVPPPALLARIRDAIRAEADPAIASGSTSVPTRLATESPAPEPAVVAVPAPVRAPGFAPIVPVTAARASRRPLYAAIALAAALAVVAVGLGARVTSLGSDLDRSRAEVASLGAEIADQTAVMAVAANPAHRTATLQAEPLAPAAAAVVMYVPGTTQAWIVAQNLPATPAGHAYQLWYADAGGAHPLGTTSWDGTGAFVASVGVDLAHSAAVMVTLEPLGGATGAPGPQVVFGGL